MGPDLDRLGHWGGAQSSLLYIVRATICSDEVRATHVVPAAEANQLALELSQPVGAIGTVQAVHFRTTGLL